MSFSLFLFLFFCWSSPTSSLQSVLIDPPVSLSSPVVVSHMPTLAGTSQASVASPSIVRRIGGKPAMGAITGAGAGVALGVKKGRRRKDPNEPQKPVSAYALFFRDTQAAIKGQNPNATFGEVSKIVASMWDSLGEEQKQVLLSGQLHVLSNTCTEDSQRMYIFGQISIESHSDVLCIEAVCLSILIRCCEQHDTTVADSSCIV